MFKRYDNKTELQKYFVYLEILIQKENIGVRTDINNECEDIIKNILNLTYDLQLKNVNEEKINYPAIDLADEKNNICYQITSNITNCKINDTIAKFEKYELNKKYGTVNILFLKTEQKSKSLKNSHKENSNYKILFLSDLIKAILETNKIEEVLNYLREEVGIKMIQKSKRLVSYNEVPMLDICNDTDIYIYDFDDFSPGNLMYNFYGNCFSFSEKLAESQNFRLEFEIRNSGKIPINNICIYNLSVSSNIHEVFSDVYTIAPICEYSKYIDIDNLISPNKILKLNLIFENNYDEDDDVDELFIAFYLDIVSDYSTYKNTIQVEIFCNKTDNSEELIAGRYKIDAIKFGSQVYNNSSD